MSKVSSTISSVSDGTLHAFYMRLAAQFGKPIEYVKRCCEVHNVTSLPKFRTPDDGLGDFYSDMTAHFDITPSRTKQEFTEECDINTIMARFKASGGDPTVLPLNSRQARYGDFTSMPESYHAALNYVTDTKHEFMKLDAKIRARFDNDPQAFLNFVSDPNNGEELVKLGLASLVPASEEPPTQRSVSEEGTTAKGGKPSVKASSKVSNEGLEGD